MIVVINALILVPTAYLSADSSNAGNISAEEARIKIEQMGLNYNDNDYRKAIKADNREAVELYLAGGMSPNISGASLDTPILFDLSERGMLEMVQLLIKGGADINATNYGGKTVLQTAASHGNGAIVYELIKAGAKITKEAKTAAAGGGYTDIAKMMEDAESGILNEKIVTNYLLVHRVEDKQCQEKAVADLIRKGADVNKRNSYRQTLLMIANKNNCNEIASMLMKAHAKVNEMDKFHRTVLMHACEKKNANIVRMLLEGGANANMKDDEGVSALIRAAKNGYYENVIELLKHGAQMNDRDSLLGRTALMWAAYYGHKNVVHELLQAGANPDEKDYEGWTALHWAVYKGNDFLLKKLSQISVHIHASSAADKHVKVDEMNREAMVKDLIDHGADANAVSNTLGISPIMWASFGGEEGTIEMLIEAGAQTNAKTKYYDMNPLIFAFLGGNAKLPQQLESSWSCKNSCDNSRINVCVNQLLLELLRKVPWTGSHDEPYFDEDFIDDRLKETALHALSRTANGVLSLLTFMKNHPNIDQHTLSSFIKFESIKDKLDRNFWVSVTRNLENTPDVVKSFVTRLPYEERLQLEDIWIEWLNKVNSKSLKNENNSISIVKHATDALYGIYDERLIPVYNNLLSITAPNYLTIEPAEYLYRMGDPKSYQRIASYLGSNTGKWSPLLTIADEKNAVDYVKRFGSPNSQNLDKLPKNRPDLARGAVRYILNNPEYLAYLKNESSASASPQKSNLLEFISNGASVLKDEELIEWLHKAEQWKLPEFMMVWIKIMENRDTGTGNNELFKYATIECYSANFNSDSCGKLKSSAARALGKRLLGQHRTGIIKQLESMPENKRAELVLLIMKSMNIFPCIFLEGEQNTPPCHSCFISETPRQNCGEWCCVPPESPRYYIHHDIADEPLAPLLQKYEDKILDWIRWARFFY